MIYSTSIDKVGLVATSLQEQPHVPQRGLSDKDHLHCNYCGKSQHTKEYCWKLHGRPTKGVEELKIERTISSGRLQDGLYLLDDSCGFSNLALVVKVNFKKYIPIENGDTHSNLKDSECANPINAELDDGIGPELSVLYDNDKGLEHACMLESVSKVSSRSITKGPFLKDSTLMKPTASQLAKQNQPHVKNANASRSRKTAAVKSNRKQDPSSYLHQAAKRQKLESGHLCKALHILNARTQLDLVHKVPEKKIGPADFPRLKLTIPKEPVLETARRARNFRAQRSSNAKHLQEGMVPTTSTFKARPLNRKILEAPSLLLAQKSTPRMPNFKEFNLRTRERAIQHCSAISSSLNTDCSHIPSTVQGDVTESKRFEHENSGPSKLSNDDKKAEDSRNVSSIFKARPLNNKIFSGKGDFGIFRSTKRQITIPKEFNFSTTERCEQAPLTELFNKKDNRLLLPRQGFHHPLMWPPRGFMWTSKYCKNLDKGPYLC
ncbi:uncharacterized protein [Elaeis guineensis]|uniref:uncharacterized protein isoform X4 n=1 Tax=Elaeis guineensis var. tenera TaxID=51953 RepID=UPI003C6D3209